MCKLSGSTRLDRAPALEDGDNLIGERINLSSSRLYLIDWMCQMRTSWCREAKRRKTNIGRFVGWFYQVIIVEVGNKDSTRVFFSIFFLLFFFFGEMQRNENSSTTEEVSNLGLIRLLRFGLRKFGK